MAHNIISKSRQETWWQIIGNWLPELVSITIIISLPTMFNAYLVASLQSASIYGALGAATNFLFTLTKLGESIPVAATAII